MINASALRDTPTLVGERIRLVPLGPEHTDAYFSASLDEEIRRLTGSHRHLTYEDARERCERRPADGDRLDLAIISREDGSYLGDLFLYAISPENESAGYHITLSALRFAGQGLGREATRLVLEYAFDRVGLHRIWLYVYTFNMRAIAVYRSCGFTVEGRLRDSLFWEGRRHDALLMGVLRSDIPAKED
ncbi:GNAT family N-acetyltransferase [Nocardiopsis sp. CNT312]|uniref:GNAT family N-acetyltransferase n=1 Tax=Nocardiopsis sp. CNT312 TaxID=1137268 RepID=UPI00048F6CB7|nr:GNAT family protein [Nocardiopsis sp. CNT312]